VVLTSSFAAIAYGHRPRTVPFTEADWTNTTANVSAYVKSKALAERAAWRFIAEEGGALELSVVNPAFVLGPVLGPDLSSSTGVIKRMLDGAIPGYPQLYFGPVDVRDVADLHLRAMTHSNGKGERFLAWGGDVISLREVGMVLKARMGEAAKKVPSRQLPNWLVRLAALRDPSVRQMVSELGKVKRGTHVKAKNLLGWAPRSNDDAIVATAESLMHLGLVRR
jgi:dihydroflavonol-4-reductase